MHLFLTMVARTKKPAASVATEVTPPAKPQTKTKVAPPAPAPVEATSAPAASRTKAKTKTQVWMLHDPETMASAGKYNSATHRNAALKAATKGFKTILLRETNTKEVQEYEGSTVPLSEPKRIPRGDREIVYTKKPAVKFIRSYEFAGATDDDPRTDDKENVPVS